MKISREEAIAAVLDASDGHFGRIVREDEPVWRLRDEEPPWFPELRRVIANGKASGALFKKKRKRKTPPAPRCPGSGVPISATDVRAPSYYFNNPHTVCPRCRRDVGTMRRGNGWAVANHSAPRA